jgi:hypothetical protein
VVVKRKYTEAHPEKAVSDSAPIRERILAFVKEKKEVTHTQLMEFISNLNEETGGSTSRKWVNKNTRYFTVKEKHNTKYYKLSIEGKRVYNAINRKMNESILFSFEDFTQNEKPE